MIARSSHTLPALCISSNTGAAVQRISSTYEVRGMLQTITSYNNATPGSGTILDQAQFN